MTHYEKFVNLYREVGVELKEGRNLIRQNDGGVSIIIETGDDPKISGYVGFVTEISFDSIGNFISQEIYE